MYIHALVNTMTFLCSCRNTGGYIYITCFVWLKVTTSSIHVSLISNNLFVFDGTLIVIGLVLDICLCFKSWHGPKCHSLSSFSYCKEYLYVRNIFIPTLPSLWGLLLLHSIKFGFTSRYSLSVKSRSDFPKLCFFMLCYVTLFICLYSCPIQHVPAESALSAGEIRRLELVLLPTLVPLIARCWPEVQLVVPWRVRLLDRIDLLLYRPTICPIQRGSLRALGR